MLKPGGLQDSGVERRQDPMVVVVLVENGGARDAAKPTVMRQLEPESGFRAGLRFVTLSLLVLIIFAALGGVYQWLWPRLSGLLPLFFAGLAGIGIGILACKVPELVRALHDDDDEAETVPIDPGEVEIDLRSISPIEAQVVGEIPQLSLALRVTNFIPYDITVTEVSATVAFSQVPVEMSLKRSVEIPAYKTGQDVILRQPLEGTIVTALDRFFDQKENLSRCVYVTVELTFSCAGESFRRRPETFQRYLPEILSIRRWNPPRTESESAPSPAS
jgi:hypothetical protein